MAGCAGSLIAYRFGAVSEMSYGLVASLTALAVAYLGGITSVSGAVTAGVVATAGVAFFALTEVIGSLGPWSALIGGVLLIVTAIQNPEGIAGAVRTRSAEARRRRQRARPADDATSSAASTDLSGREARSSTGRQAATTR